MWLNENGSAIVRIQMHSENHDGFSTIRSKIKRKKETCESSDIQAKAIASFAKCCLKIFYSPRLSGQLVEMKIISRKYDMHFSLMSHVTNSTQLTVSTSRIGFYIYHFFCPQYGPHTLTHCTHFQCNWSMGKCENDLVLLNHLLIKQSLPFLLLKLELKSQEENIKWLNCSNHRTFKWKYLQPNVIQFYSQMAAASKLDSM